MATESVKTRADVPVSLNDCINSLEVLDRIEGSKLANRDKLKGCIVFLLRFNRGQQ